MRPIKHMVPPVHPSHALIPVAMPDDFSSFILDDDGAIVSAFQKHWETLQYLRQFHIYDPDHNFGFWRADTSPFPDAIQTYEYRLYGFRITMRICEFDVGAGPPAVGYQFYSTGPVGLDLRFTAPDCQTASERLHDCWKARVRWPMMEPPVIPIARAESIVFGGEPLRISKLAPELTLLAIPEKRTRALWIRRIIRDPYMAVLWQRRIGDYRLRFFSERDVIFEVPSREAGLEWIANAFQRLEEK